MDIDELRDHFAGLVLPAVYREYWLDCREQRFTPNHDWPIGVAKDAYRMADAMMEIRFRIVIERRVAERAAQSPSTAPPPEPPAAGPVP